MFGANAIWGLMSPVAKFVMLGGIVTPLAVTDLRIVGAMILFWILSFFRKSEHVPPKDLAKLFGASLLGVVLNQGSFILGVGMTSPVNASIITTSMPLWAMILAAIFLKEPITAKKVLGIAAGASGALLLVLGSGNTDSAGGHSVAGDLLVLFAQLSYALYFVLYKNFVTRYSLTTIMKWMFTFATLCILPFTGRDLLSTDWQALSAVRSGMISTRTKFWKAASAFAPGSRRRAGIGLFPGDGCFTSDHCAAEPTRCGVSRAHGKPSGTVTSTLAAAMPPCAESWTAGTTFCSVPWNMAGASGCCVRMSGRCWSASSSRSERASRLSAGR